MSGTCVAIGRPARAAVSLTQASRRSKPEVNAVKADAPPTLSRLRLMTIDRPRGLVHSFEPDARSDEAPFLRAEQAYAQAARTFGYVRREQACKPKRDRDAAGVIHRAFAMRMAVDMRADHDPIRASARQIGNQHARARGIIIAGDAHAGGWRRAVRRTADRVRRFDADAERRDAGAAVASARPRYGADALFRMRDQKPDRAHLLRQRELDAAVHVGAREWIFVAHHHDTAADAVRVPLEILHSAQAEVEDFRQDARRRCRAPNP